MISPQATSPWRPATNPSTPSQLRPIDRQLHQLVKPSPPQTPALTHTSNLSQVWLLRKQPLRTSEGGEMREPSGSTEKKLKHPGRRRTPPHPTTPHPPLLCQSPSKEVIKHQTTGFVPLSAQRKLPVRLRGRSFMVKKEGKCRPHFKQNHVSCSPLMKTWVVRVFSVLIHLKGARDSHQYGCRDPGEMKGKQSGVMGQNLKTGPAGVRKSPPTCVGLMRQIKIQSSHLNLNFR